MSEMLYGVLIFNNSSEPLKTKIGKAVDYFKKKYGRRPDLCRVHPSALIGQQLPKYKKLKVEPYRPVLPGHIWVGVEDKKGS